MEEIDRRTLAFVAAHPLVELRHAVHFAAGVEDQHVEEALCRLRRTALLRRHELLLGGEPVLQISQPGLVAIGSHLDVPVLDLARLREDLIGVSLWLAAREGKLGPMARVLSRREVIALDRSAERSGGSLTGFRLRVEGEPRYPLLSLSGSAGHRIAVEALWWPGRAFEPEALFRAYRELPKLDAVLVIVAGSESARLVRRAAERTGMSDRAFIRHGAISARLPRGWGDVSQSGSALFQSES